MEVNKNKSNIIIIILSILLVIAIGVICFLLFNNKPKNITEINNNTSEVTVENNNEENEKKEEVNNIVTTEYKSQCDDQKLFVDVDENKYKNIFSYIREQDNVKISYDDYEMNEDGSIKGHKLVNLNKEETDKLLEKLVNNDYAIDIYLGGLGGAPSYSIYFDYERKNVKYNVEFYFFNYFSSNDGNAYKIVEKDVSKIQGTSLISDYGCGYSFSNLAKILNFNIFD